MSKENENQQDQNKKMAKSKDPGLHTKQEGEPDENEKGGDAGTGTVSTGGSSDGTGTV